MRAVDIEEKRILDALRRRIHERGFTQLEVQQKVGWGRTYLSNLFTRRIKLRFDHIFLILDAIGVEPREFFIELSGRALSQTIPVGMKRPGHCPDKRPF